VLSEKELSTVDWQGLTKRSWRLCVAGDLARCWT